MEALEGSSEVQKTQPKKYIISATKVKKMMLDEFATVTSIKEVVVTSQIKQVQEQSQESFLF